MSSAERAKRGGRFGQARVECLGGLLLEFDQEETAVSGLANLAAALSTWILVAVGETRRPDGRVSAVQGPTLRFELPVHHRRVRPGAGPPPRARELTPRPVPGLRRNQLIADPTSTNLPAEALMTTDIP